jgi:septum formation inhibitor-activating ATPase MinD
VIFDNKSWAGQAYNNIARRLVGQNVPFLPLQEPPKPSWLQRLLGR